MDQIQALDLSEFVSARDHLKPETVAGIVSSVRSFLRFLTMRGILRKDFSAELPKIHVPEDATIPSVWDQELLVRLLGVVDRSSAKGKRDYAILLLACRLGLRAGDIRTLKLDNLRWEKSTIEITQAKTGTPLILPLTNEVGEALIDYLKSSRPQTTHREVFLTVNPPFDPFKENDRLYHIVAYWRRPAGSTFRSPQRRGIHSLRHTLATRLLEKGIPFTTIAEILGHTSLESIRIYAKTDVEAPADSSNSFQSVLAVLMEKFLQEKHACGYDYHEPTRILRHLYNFLMQEGLTTCELPSSIARKWLAKKGHESAETQRQRIVLVRQFSRFLLRLGYSAYVPDSALAARNPRGWNFGLSGRVLRGKWLVCHRESNERAASNNVEQSNPHRCDPCYLA